jgi:PAS domain S-box-containing protein
VTELSRAQLQAWHSSCQLASTAIGDPRASPARLRGRLRNALGCLRESIEAARRLADLVSGLRRDITTERDRFSGLIAQLPLPYLVTSADGTIQQVNPAACAVLDVSARALIGRNLLIFLDDREGWRQLLAQTAASRVDNERPGRLRPRERLRVPVTATVSCVDTVNGPAIQWFLNVMPAGMALGLQKSPALADY